MKVLLCHNYYQIPGGEDQVFSDESSLLESHGHFVMTYTRHNDDINEMSNFDRFRKTLWNHDTTRDLESLLATERPQVMHCTNTFPLISPSVFAVAQKYGVRVVQSIHNYRLLCATATFLRDGKICEACLGKKFAYPAIRHGCYRDNRAATAVVATYQAYHRWRRTWHRNIDRFVALTHSSREKLIQGGLPSDKIEVKTNFIATDPGMGSGEGKYILFIGRLSSEKGIEVLVDAWRRNPDLPRLIVVGDGPLSPIVQVASDELANFSWAGRQPTERIFELLHQARALVLPSVCYEVCPKTIIEAFAKGCPVIASRLGGMEEMIDHRNSGHLFTAGDANDLAQSVRTVNGLERSQHDRMRRAARDCYLARHTSEANYERLMEIYQLAGVSQDSTDRE